MANDGKVCRGFYGIEVTPDYVKAIDHYSAWIEKYAEEHPEYTIRCENEKEWRKTFRQIVQEKGFATYWCKADSHDKYLYAGTPVDADLLGPFDTYEEASFRASLAQSHALTEEYPDEE